jgi:hypothetical protein
MAATRARRRRGLRKLSVEVNEDELRAIALKGYEGAAHRPAAAGRGGLFFHRRLREPAALKRRTGVRSARPG